MEKKPIRDGFGEGLLELGKTHPNVVALSGDLEDSARAIWNSKRVLVRGTAMHSVAAGVIGTAQYIGTCREVSCLVIPIPDVPHYLVMDDQEVVWPTQEGDSFEENELFEAPE